MTKSFEQVLDQEKNELTEALILFGEGRRVRKALADLEMNRPEFYKFYGAGKQSRQAEIDLLQKRIELALDHTTNHGGYDDLTHIINILKGGTNE